jgi:hypothetical protein
VQELERQAADYNYLLARRHSAYPVGAYVEEISRLLPDNTWLQQLDIRTAGKSKELVITGETASSSRLIELLEQSRMMQNAGPRGPTTRGSLPNVERFMIGAELKPRTRPRPSRSSRGQAPPPQSPPPQSSQTQARRLATRRRIPRIRRKPAPQPTGPRTDRAAAPARPAPSPPASARRGARPPPQGANVVQPQPPGRAVGSAALPDRDEPAPEPQQSRRTAAGLLAGAALLVLGVVIVPFYLLNRHYDSASRT